MNHELEDRIAKAALAGSVAAGGVAIAVFLLTGQVALDAATSTISLTFDPAFQGVVGGGVLIAGLLKVGGRVARALGRRA